MSLIHWKPKQQTQSLTDLLDWDRSLMPFTMFPVSRMLNDRFFESWQPAIDISEDKDNYYVKADLPGVSKDGIKVAVEDNVLSIKGERKHEQETKDKNYHRVERSYGTFERRFTLGEVKDDKIKAEYKDGVLHVTIPKAEPAKSKHIDISIT